MSRTILIIAPALAAEPIANALREELDAAVEVAPQRRAGLAALRRTEYSLVLLEESLAELDPRGADLLYQNAGAAPVLESELALREASPSQAPKLKNLVELAGTLRNRLRA